MMKLKQKIVFGKNEENILLLAAMGIIALNSVNGVSVSSSESVGINGEESAEASALPVAEGSYISKIGRVLSANDYQAIKTLYKLQSVVEDIGAFSVVDIASVSQDSSDISNVLNEITPYMPATKRSRISGMMNNIDRTRKTYEDIRGIRAKISSLPEDSTKTDRLRTIINELPNISGVPILNSLGNIKNVISMMKPQNVTATGDASEPANTVDAEYEDIYELMEMFENKKKASGGTNS